MTKYSEKFKHTVMKYAGKHTMKAASLRYKVAPSVIDYWLDNALGMTSSQSRYYTRKQLAKVCGR